MVRQPSLGGWRVERRRALLARVMLAAACLLAAPAVLAQDHLVKTSGEYFVDPDYGYTYMLAGCSVTSFSPAPRRPTPAGPELPRTVNPIVFRRACSYEGFVIGNPFGRTIFSFEPMSLNDLGTYVVTCTRPMYQSATCRIDSSFPCGAYCEPAGAFLAGRERVFTFNVYNYPPTARIVPGGMRLRADGTAAWNSSLVLQSNAADRDPGTVTTRWSVTPPRRTAGARIGDLSARDLSVTFTGEQDFGVWSFTLDVVDAQGERLEPRPTHTVTVSNSDPEIRIAGPARVQIPEPLALSVTPTADEDGGGDLAVTWEAEVVRHGGGVSRRTLPPGATFRLDRTTGADIGTWTVRARARDNEGATGVATHTFEVVNRPPVITLDPRGPLTVRAGRPISFRNSTPEDPDGGTVVHEWELVQAPLGVGESPRRLFRTGESLSVPTTEAGAGQWIFVLHARDDEMAPTESVRETVSVTVDVGPVARITGREEFTAVETIELSGGESADPDSPPLSAAPVPCPGLTCGRGHVTSAAEVVIRGGITRWHWSLAEAPRELRPRFTPGPVEYSLFATNGTPTLSVRREFIRAGHWTFLLEVTDDEGHTSTTTHTIRIRPVSAPPVPILLPPGQFHLVTPEGVSLAPVGVDGSLSYDLDDVGAAGLPASRGISNYAWQVANAPPGCALLPTAPAGPSSNFFELFRAGAATCPGGWTLGLEVRDDDDPAQTAVGYQSLMIGNCAQEVCIDSPTTHNYKYVEFAESADVTVRYHLNSALYANPAFARGLKVEMSLYHESDPGLTAPVYVGQYDYDALTHAEGGLPAAHWHGFTRDGGRPRGGKYTVRMRAANPLLPAPYAETVARDAVWIEVVNVSIGAESDSVVSHNALEAGTGRMRIDYTASARFNPRPVFDEAFLHVARAEAPDADIAVVPIPSPASGRFEWDGRIAPRTLLAPGEYVAGVELKNRGRSLGRSEPHQFVALRLTVHVPGTPAARERTPGAVFEVGAAGRDVTVELTPPVTRGEVVLRAAGAAAAFEVLDGTTRLAVGGASGVALPAATFTPRRFSVRALEGTPTPVRFEAHYRRTGLSAARAPSDFVNLIGLTFGLVSSCVDNSVTASAGVFVQRNPRPLLAPTFGYQRYLLMPFTLAAQPAVGAASEVVLEYETGSAAIAEVVEGGGLTVAALPRTWSGGDFTSGVLNVALGVNGVSAGEVVLRARYRSDGVDIATRRVRLRVGELPGLAGLSRTEYPHFLYTRTANEGTQLRVALDPGRLPERVERRAAVYVLPHRAPADWGVNPSLAGAVAGPLEVTLRGGGVTANEVLIPPLPPGAYDVVYDFGNCPSDPARFATDARLDPGDIIDALSEEGPSIQVVPRLAAAGAAAFASAEYGASRRGPPGPTSPVVGAGYEALPADMAFRLRGKLVFPTSVTPGDRRPLVVFAHGVHDPLWVLSSGVWTQVNNLLTSDENYRGHTYLQEHLASHGYVTLSVDLDDLYDGDASLGYPPVTPLGPRTTASVKLRANLILRNIRYVLDNLATVAGAEDLTGRVDPNAIYLVGHSRSGDAVLAARALLDGRLPAPGGPSGAPPPPYGIAPADIRGIVALSPTTYERQGAPDGVPYLLIYGSADGDVDGALVEYGRPFRAYDWAAGPAHMIYVIDANHNFFNTSWGFSDATQYRTADLFTSPVAPLTIPVSTPPLRTADEQRDIAKAYLLAFLRRYWENRKEYEAYFSLPPAVLRPAGLPDVPVTSLMRRPAASRLLSPSAPGATVVLDNYEVNFADTDAERALASSGRAVSYSGSLNPLGHHPLREEFLLDRDPSTEADITNRFFQETKGVLFGWQAWGSYAVELPAGPSRDLRGSSVALRMAQQPNHPLTPFLDALDFELVLEDVHGNRSAVRASALTSLQPIHQTQVTDDPLTGPLNTETTKAVFETLVFPTWAFEANGRQIDLGQIVKVMVVVGQPYTAPTGRVAVDDIEIWKR